MKSSDIHPLAPRLSEHIRSSAAIASCSTVVEELLLNALDAQASKIEVYLDIANYHIKVTDNGMGIKAEDLQEVVGEFSATSKHTGSSYGCKGEALAAISAISKVEIVSKERGAAECYFKRLHGSDRLTHRSSRGPQGTTVTVNDIFHNIPVRRKCIRPSSELPRVKEIVRKMAVLHYRVSFVLYDHGGRKIVLNIPQDISISPRVVRLHSAAVLSSMTACHCTAAEYCLTGLISDPTLDSCSATKDCQYVYVNNRFVRGGDVVSSLINEAYKRTLVSPSGGPRAQHYSSESPRGTRYPNFVLQLKLPEEDYDVLVEPDKSFVLFMHLDTIRECVELLLLDLFQTHHPELLSRLSNFLRGQAKPISSLSIDLDAVPLVVEAMSRRSPARLDDDTAQAAKLGRSSSLTDKAAHTGGNSVTAVSFDCAWGEDSPGIIDAPSDWSPVSVPYIDASVSITPDRVVVVMRGHDELTAHYDHILGSDASDSNDVEYSPTFTLESSITGDYSDASVMQPEKRMEGADCTPTEFSIHSEEYYDIPCGESAEANYTLIDTVAQRRVLDVDLSKDFSVSTESLVISPEPSGRLGYRGDRTMTEKISVTKDQIQDFEFVSQLDCKYIIAVAGGTIFAIDQHAADERVKFELYTAALEQAFSSRKGGDGTVPVGVKECLPFVPAWELQVTEEVCLSYSQAAVVQRHDSLLAAWGFRYDLLPSNRGRAAPKKKRKRSSSVVDTSAAVCFAEEESVLHLSHAPIVLNEQLTALDFREFIDNLSTSTCAAFDVHFTGADLRSDIMMMHKPPCVHRILASKACRNAIKFGDSLCPRECAAIIAELGKTNIPFQCAHGRPTIFPALNMSYLHHGPADEAADPLRNLRKKPNFAQLLGRSVSAGRE